MCSLVIDRDLNAAINIRDIGIADLIGADRAEFTPVEIPLMEICDSSQISHVSLKQEIHLVHSELTG